MTDALGAPDLPALLEHRAWVRALARRLCADENDVDDVEQETWSVAMRRRPDEPRALRSWLGVVASRLALQRKRGESRRVRREEAVAAPEADERSTADVVATADAHGHVVQAVLALDEPYRTTVLLRYFEGLEIAVVARRMDVPVETVRTRLKRAHERLRATLAPDDDRSLLLLLAPAAKTAATAVATASFVHAAAVVACVVAVGAGGAWLLTRTTDADVAGVTAKAPVVAAVPPRPSPGPVAASAGADGADGANGADGTNGADGAPGQDGEPGKPAEPSPAPQEKPAAPVEPSDPWIAYDLADGRPISGLKLLVTKWEGATTVTTDPAGRVNTERANVTDLAAEPGGGWYFAKPTSGPVKDEPSLWFWRERPVTGTVASGDPAKPRQPDVRFSCAVSGAFTDPRAPGRGTRWLTAHGLGFRSDLPNSVGADSRGVLSGAAPAIRGVMLTAEADGFTPTVNPLVWDADDRCALTYTLRPTLHIVGRLLDAAGEAVVGETVQLDTSIDAATDEDVARAQGMHPRGGFMSSGTPGHRVVALTDQAKTDARGIFRFDAPAVGTQVVYVKRPGCLDCRKDLGKLTADAIGFEMRLAPSDARVLVRDAGVTLASATLVVQVADTRENGFMLTTDKDGCADFGWLQRGRWYRVSRHDDPKPGRSVCVRWDGRMTLDLDRLPNDPKDDK